MIFEIQLIKPKNPAERPKLVSNYGRCTIYQVTGDITKQEWLIYIKYSG